MRGVPRDRTERVRVARARQRAQRDDLAAGGLGDLREHARIADGVDGIETVGFRRALRTPRARGRAASSRAAAAHALVGIVAGDAAERRRHPSTCRRRRGGRADLRPRAPSRQSSRGRRAESPRRTPGGRPDQDACDGSGCGIGRAASSRNSSLVAATSLWGQQARCFSPCQETNHVILVVIGRRAGRRGCSFFLNNVFISKNADPAAALVLVSGIGTTACDKLGLGEEDPTSPSPVAPVHLSVTPRVGASDVVGYGSSAPAWSFSGIAPTARATCSSRPASSGRDGYTVTVTNLGIPTAPSSAGASSSSACSTATRSSAT